MKKGFDIKCNAATWSCGRRYAIAAFSRSVSRRIEENLKVTTNIQVFDCLTNTRIHKLERTYGNFVYYK